ncbi:MAG: hypothetical protein RUMPE_00944 [Eubacteriales bacterium SKADARSKE-1]|nr:hypothetical protein [Eubacteriales bacterium SKADARSKE-1]
MINSEESQDQKSQQEQQQLAEFMLSNIVEMGKFSYRLQEKREKILMNQAGLMLIAVSISLAVLPLLVPVIYIPYVFTGLAVSLVFTVMAGWRFKYSQMTDAGVIFDEVNKNYECYETKCQFDMQWKMQLDIIHKSKAKITDKRIRFLLASMVSFICSVVLSAILMWF